MFNEILTMINQYLFPENVIPITMLSAKDEGNWFPLVEHELSWWCDAEVKKRKEGALKLSLPNPMLYTRQSFPTSL